MEASQGGGPNLEKVGARRVEPRRVERFFSGVLHFQTPTPSHNTRQHNTTHKTTHKNRSGFDTREQTRRKPKRPKAVWGLQGGRGGGFKFWGGSFEGEGGGFKFEGGGGLQG